MWATCLYKLFATALCARLTPSLHKVQPPDQADFRPNHRCEDHLTVYSILGQRNHEWGVPLYINTIDFTECVRQYQAFGDLEFSETLWGQAKIRHTVVKAPQAMRRNSLDKQKNRNISFLKKDQTRRPAVISLIQHGAPILAGEQFDEMAREQKKGIKLHDKTEDCQTNLRFANDVLLFFKSLKKLRDMLCNFKASADKVGLGIHPNKTKILSNQNNTRIAPSLHKIQPLDQARFRPNHGCKDHLAQGSTFERLILICVPHTSWHDLPYRGTMWQSCFFFSFFQFLLRKSGFKHGSVMVNIVLACFALHLSATYENMIKE